MCETQTSRCKNSLCRLLVGKHGCKENKLMQLKCQERSVVSSWVETTDFLSLRNMKSLILELCNKNALGDIGELIYAPFSPFKNIWI